MATSDHPPVRPARILVLRGGALGDFLVTLPALGLLRTRWPDARIELIGNPVAATLAVGRHYLDAVHSQHDARWASLGANLLAPNDPLARWLREFDLVLNYWPDPDGAIAADFRRLGFAGPGGDAPWFVTHPPHPSMAPAAAHYCAALAPLGLAATDFTGRLWLNESDHTAATALLGPGDSRPLIAWHPGSGSVRKNWPQPRWIDAIARLPSHRLLVLLGPAESRALSDQHHPPAGAIILRNLPTPVLAAVLQRCALFLGHDSGPAHVAAAAGCPCVLVFGPTDPTVWAPPHPKVQAFRHGDSTVDVSVETIVKAARKLLADGRLAAAP